MPVSSTVFNELIGRQFMKCCPTRHLGDPVEIKEFRPVSRMSQPTQLRPGWTDFPTECQNPKRRRLIQYRLSYSSWRKL